MTLPRITIITPSFNQASYLEATLVSVLSQHYPNLEFAVVDGGSSDGSVEIIQRYADQLTWWVSERDGGQADAIVKGFARASGDVLNWLNSDDLLLPGALRAVGEAFASGRHDVVAGRDRQFTDDPGAPVSHFVPAGYRHPECLRFWDGRFRYHQPCTFFTRSAYERAGGLDRSLHYAMDYDLYCRMLALPEVSVGFIDAELTAFRLHPEAKTRRAKTEVLRELRAVSQRYWPAGWGAKEQRGMDAYSAECSLAHAAEALRARSWGRASAALREAVHYSPAHAARVAWRKARSATGEARG